MSGAKVWETGYPQLPEGYSFDIEVVIDGTKVRLIQGQDFGQEPLMQYVVPAQYHEPQNEYLTKVWNAMNQMALKIKDRLEREEWIREHFA